MNKLFLVLLLTQITLAEDINIWISNAQQNSVSVSMVANTEVVGFQFGIDVLEFEGDLFAPMDSIFYNDTGEKIMENSYFYFSTPLVAACTNNSCNNTNPY